MKRIYNVSELRRIVEATQQEFKPVMGKDVEKDNRSNSEKTYQNAEKKAKSYDGGLTNQKKKTTNYPPNYRGLETLRPQNITDEMRKRFDAQAQGYIDDKHKKAHQNEPLGNGEYSDDSLTKALAAKAKEDKEGREMAAKIGLTGSKSNIKSQDDTMYESKKMQKLNFKHTTFMTENHMLSKVPDSYKIEGKSFLMCDKNKNEYLVEWHDEPIVTNKTKINEDFNRIKALFNYKSGVVTSNAQTRLAENTKFDDVLSKARRLMHS